MKVCKNCNFSKKEPMGPQYVYFCQHSECVDPVDGAALPCLAARQQPVFCGIEAKYFKKSEEPVVAPLIDISQAKQGIITSANN